MEGKGSVSIIGRRRHRLRCTEGRCRPRRGACTALVSFFPAAHSCRTSPSKASASPQRLTDAVSSLLGSTLSGFTTDAHAGPQASYLRAARAKLSTWAQQCKHEELGLQAPASMPCAGRKPSCCGSFPSRKSKYCPAQTLVMLPWPRNV